MNREAFAQATKATQAPVIISHCAVGELYKKPGGAGSSDQPKGETDSTGTDRLNDVTIRAMARNWGTICIHFVTPDYILPRHGTREARVVDLVDHIEYIRDLVGIDYVSLGTDFFPEVNWQWVEGAGRLRLAPNVTREMVRRGFADEQIQKVLGGNLVRVFAANCERQAKVVPH